MKEEKIKLIGQLIDDKKPVTLIVTDNYWDLDKTISEYKSVFPDIFLTAEWGYFKTPISTEKKKALGNILHILQSPLQNLFTNLHK